MPYVYGWVDRLKNIYCYFGGWHYGYFYFFIVVYLNFLKFPHCICVIFSWRETKIVLNYSLAQKPGNLRTLTTRVIMKMPSMCLKASVLLTFLEDRRHISSQVLQHGWETLLNTNITCQHFASNTRCTADTQGAKTTKRRKTLLGTYTLLEDVDIFKWYCKGRNAPVKGWARKDCRDQQWLLKEVTWELYPACINCKKLCCKLCRPYLIDSRLGIFFFALPFLKQLRISRCKPSSAIPGH